MNLVIVIVTLIFIFTSWVTPVRAANTSTPPAKPGAKDLQGLTVQEIKNSKPNEFKYDAKKLKSVGDRINQTVTDEAKQKSQDWKKFTIIEFDTQPSDKKIKP